MAIPAVVGLGLSAISTVSGISNAQKAARRQEEASEMAAADARQRVEMAQEEFKFVSEQAKRLRDQELMMVSDQRRSSQLQLTQQVLGSRISEIQTQMEAQGMKSQALEVANQLLHQAQQEAAGVGEMNTDALRQLNQTSPEIKGRMGTRAQELQQENVLNMMEQARGDILEGNQNRRGQSNQNIQMAGVMGGIQKTMMNIAADAAIDQAAQQQRILEAQLPHARKAQNIQAQRNRAAINAKMYSNQATANMAALSTAVQERSNIQSIEAQRASIQKPGILSYLQAGASLYNQGMSAGLWNQPQSRYAGGQQYASFTPMTSVADPNLSGMASFSRSPLMDRLNGGNAGRITDVTGNIYG